MSLSRAFLSLMGVALFGAAGARAQGEPDYEQPPVSYSASTPHDALTRLQARIAAGEVTLAGDELAMLQKLLGELGVPVDSQMLVFSRTSFQRGRIRPDQPRALYFSDSVYVGWVPGGLVEVTAIDPKLGPIFYTLELPGPRRGPLKVERDADCLRCHGGAFVREIPGVFARSLFPDANGDPLLRHGTMLVDDETPFEQRWGGWYVTGYHGTPPHRGNAVASELKDQLVFEPAAQRPDELSGKFDVSAYLRPTSDVVALLVFEHQMAMQNSLVHAAFAVRRMTAYQHGLQKTFKEPETDEPAYDSVRSVFASTVLDVVDHLLFRNAAPLPAGVTGHGGFRKNFAQDAPRSRDGHALKDLFLDGRLFAQRCSYLIYSESFRALPETLRVRILDRLESALLSRDPKDRYAYLPAEEKQRIHAILLETQPDAKARWTR
ncbi:MAG: hypothetical protein NTV51_20550 [Verrucomicrobia bacterium]|nr:hypothetical protein [Verrucomicrobiota bacterium]